MNKSITRIGSVALGLAVLIGCSREEPAPHKSTPDTGDTLMYQCNYTDTALAADDAALGTTPADIQAELDGLHEHPATWADDGSTAVASVDITVDTTQAILRESEGCGSYIAIPATVSLDTDDGGISAVFDMELEISEGGLAAYATIDESELGGSWTPPALDANESRRGISLRLERGDNGLVGQLMDETEGDDGTVAWAGAEVVLELGEGTRITL